jgi:type I restriction enzyme M protein
MTDARSSDLGQAMGLLRGPLDASAARNLIFALLYLRVSDPENWESVRSSRGFNVVESLSCDPTIREIISLPSIYDALPAPAFAQLVEIVDRVTQREEAAAVFEQLLESFADLGGQRDNGFYTPRSVTSILASILAVESAPSFYDPACGSGELLLAAAEHMSIRPRSVMTYGSAIDSESLYIARMNLTLHGIPNNISLRGRGNYSELFDAPQRFSRVLANPPFSQRWSDFHPKPALYARPAKGRPVFAWLEHAIRSLDADGRAAVIMPNVTLFSANRYDIAARQRMLDDGCVEAIITLPPELFHHTRIPVCVWLLLPPGPTRDQVLLIDASTAGHMVNRTRREISGKEIAEIAEAIRMWRSRGLTEITSSTAAVSLAEIRERNYNLSPGVYIKAAPVGTDLCSTDLSVEQLMSRLDSLKEAADAKDAAAEQLLRRLKW